MSPPEELKKEEVHTKKDGGDDSSSASGRDGKFSWSQLLQLAVGLGGFLAVVVTIVMQFNSMRDRIGALEVRLAEEAKDRQYANERAKERLGRDEEALKEWSADEFSEVCRFLDGHYVTSEHYCELKDGRILKYKPIVFR